MVQTPTDSFAEPPDLAPVPGDAEAKAFCPIAIDGAQLQAVSWAEAGRSFVIEGPPGTGKSQTITNLIANAVAAGKTILFVAEKQAALDVVRRRLDSVGLGDLCLDLHGKDQTSDKMRKQLSAALHLATTSNPQSWDTIRARHQTAVDSLGRYPAGLHEPGGARLSAWTARQTLLAVGEGPEVEIPAAVVAAPLDVDGIYDAARELTNALYDLGSGPRAHPWRLSELEDVSDAGRRGRVVTAVRELQDAVAGLESPPLADLLRAAPDDAALVVVGGWLGADGGPFLDVAAIEAASDEAWRGRLDAARTALRNLQKDAAPLLATFTPEVLGADLEALLERARPADGKLFKGKPRKAIVAELVQVTVDGSTVAATTLSATLERLVALRGQASEVADAVDLVPGLRAPDGWNPLAESASALFEAQVAGIETSVQLVARVPGVLAVLRGITATDLPSDAAVRAARLLSTWADLRAAVEASVDSSAAWHSADGSLLDAIVDALPAWAADATTGGLVQLGRWVEVHQRLARLRHAGLADVADRITAGELHPEAIEDALRRSVARAALEERLSSGALGGFDGTVRDRAIERFSAGAEEMRRDMVAELPAKIVADRTFSPDRLVGKVGELSRELSRKRGGLKIRELFAHYGPIIAELTPCLMMSPHSVARFLPAGVLDIDLVVFDEASQVRVAEAIGAMGRAKATVVVGDSQQMPPSNIAAVSSGEEEEPLIQGVPSDMESVLSEAVESNLPRLWLSWHYRSKHESLISFSNHQYYEGRLASFPRPPHDHADMGVSWRRVQGTFERGKERVNRVEAAAIVGEIRSRLARDPEASVGVVTFNTQQRDLIMDQLEDCGDPLVAASLAAEADPLFVKNLENVQGDERDVILFSLAFSPDPDTGRLPLNFGPLIQAGGERRLNVAVTRARARVVLFASFDPSHIDLSRTSSVGLAHLRSYMEMAQREIDAPGVLRRAAARDRHRDDVLFALEDTGLCVRKDVGLSDFTVDIAVAPSPDGLWTAVFLDGEDYAVRSTVGDRETLPHGVLVGAMGWTRVVRVWLPDWVRDRAGVLARIERVAREPAPAAPAAIVSVPVPAPVAELGYRSSAAAAPPAPRLPRFEPADDRFVGLKEDLDDMAHDAAIRSTVRAEVEDVIATEGPVEVGRLARLVCRRFDLQRVSAKRAAAVLALVEPEALDATAFGTFAWPPGGARAVEGDFRVPGDDQARVLEEVAPQELLGAMRFLARTGGGISRDELLRETALLFGTRRLTAKPRAHLEFMLARGVQLGQLRDDGAAITCGSAAAADVRFGA